MESLVAKPVRSGGRSQICSSAETQFLRKACEEFAVQINREFPDVARFIYMDMRVSWGGLCDVVTETNGKQRIRTRYNDRIFK